jgi:DNA-binding NtrC family response regulator
MGKADVGLSREARDLLLAYAWPGNIRELQNAIERAVILSDGGLISAAQLGVTPSASAPGTGRVAEGPEREGLPEMEKRAVMEALRRSNGNRSKAAAALGLSRTRFYTLLRRFGLD